MNDKLITDTILNEEEDISSYITYEKGEKTKDKVRKILRDFSQ